MSHRFSHCEHKAVTKAKEERRYRNSHKPVTQKTHIKLSFEHFDSDDFPTITYLTPHIFCLIKLNCCKNGILIISQNSEIWYTAKFTCKDLPTIISWT